MTIKLYQILQFDEFYKTIKDQSFSFETAYKLSQLHNQSEKEQIFFNEQLQKIINKYGKRTDTGELVYSDDGATIFIEEDKQSVCEKAIQDLENIDIVVNYMFDFNELKMLNLTPEIANLIYPLINKEVLN